MKIRILISIVSTMGLANASWADDVSPPPMQNSVSAAQAVATDAKAAVTEKSEKVVDMTPAKQSERTDSSNEEDVHLRDELVPKDLTKGATVRSYVRKSDKANITEYSRQGRVYMVKVDPAGDAPAYYLYDENGDGQFQRHLPGNYKSINPPTWEVKKF